MPVSLSRFKLNSPCRKARGSSRPVGCTGSFLGSRGVTVQPSSRAPWPHLRQRELVPALALGGGQSLQGPEARFTAGAGWAPWAAPGSGPCLGEVVARHGHSGASRDGPGVSRGPVLSAGRQRLPGAHLDKLDASQAWAGTCLSLRRLHVSSESGLRPAGPSARLCPVPCGCQRDGSEAQSSSPFPRLQSTWAPSPTVVTVAVTAAWHILRQLPPPWNHFLSP